MMGLFFAQNDRKKEQGSERERWGGEEGRKGVKEEGETYRSRLTRERERVGERERERDRQTDRDRHKERQTDREQTDRDREG